MIGDRILLAVDQWLTPLSFLAGVGLLILSTATRSNALDQEIRMLEREEDTSLDDDLTTIFLKRADRFRNTLIALYVSFALLAMASFSGLSLSKAFPQTAEHLLEILTALGIAALMYAAVELVREARLSRRMMRLRCRPLQQRLAKHANPGSQQNQRESLTQSPFQ